MLWDLQLCDIFGGLEQPLPLPQISSPLVFTAKQKGYLETHLIHIPKMSSVIFVGQIALFIARKAANRPLDGEHICFHPQPVVTTSGIFGGADGEVGGGF